ncbi:hypothetical protein BpHYR1_050838 [Brachionus plicatilis]|uniref:Uncharacterized protein n=1 Tax=Brachionus plicatilis TaxID=10195 RepID=A0A3M7P9W7_BRAPC|nr:hypothetical protein BpHYR1_050838 [Brachionus plicatilis]
MKKTCYTLDKALPKLCNFAGKCTSSKKTNLFIFLGNKKAFLFHKNQFSGPKCVFYFIFEFVFVVDLVENRNQKRVRAGQLIPIKFTNIKHFTFDFNTRCMNELADPTIHILDT